MGHDRPREDEVESSTTEARWFDVIHVDRLCLDGRASRRFREVKRPAQLFLRKASPPPVGSKCLNTTLHATNPVPVVERANVGGDDARAAVLEREREEARPSADIEDGQPLQCARKA